MEKKKVVISTGIISLLTIFSVLVITAFSLLIYSGAQTDYELSLKTVKATQDYYEAENNAELTLQTLHKTWKATSEKDVLTAFENLGFEAQMQPDGVNVSYQVEAGLEKLLNVQVLFPNNKNEEIQRLQWQISIK